MQPSPSRLELALVVATARDMGIGANGGQPWTGPRKETAYFARVAKRGDGNQTWDSIPPEFRPRPGRLNIVVSRSSAPGLPKDPTGDPDASPVKVSSFKITLKHL